MKRSIFVPFVAAIGVALLASTGVVRSQQASVEAVSLDPDDIGGVVRGPSGPEAGVWVIAETTDLPTRYRKIVVTDGQGRYVVPDLPNATYRVWVRGYGLVDSAPVAATPGRQLALTAVPAPNARAAAEIYPANYWFSLVQIPAAREFPGTGSGGNAIAPAMQTQAHWTSGIKAGCEVCHQLGNKATREIPRALGVFDSSAAAWDHRVQTGLNGTGMSGAVSALGRPRALAMFADWTDRIAAGEVPPAPPRPEGLERNLVLTSWDWGGPSTFAHDEVTTDKRTPTVNANGPLYGVDFGNDRLLIVDPVAHRASEVAVPVRDPGTPTAVPQTMAVPSPYWGTEIYWTNRSHPHNPMLDHKGRVWTTQATRPRELQPEYCKDTSSPFMRHFPLPPGGAGVSVYDPQAGRITLIDTCFGTHHLQFAEDADHTLYFSGDANVIGWLRTRVYDETGDVARAIGWCPVVLDTTGDGRIGAYTEPDEPADPARDRRISGFPYGIIPNPVDGSIWYTTIGVPGRIVRLEIGSDPPATCKAELYEPPFDNPQRPGVLAYTPRGIDVDRNGVIWTGLSGSGHLASFDRRKCRVLSGPTATGQHCPEGWTLYRAPGPAMKGVEHEQSADFFYYNWVDQFDTLGLGANRPIANGTGSDSLLVLQPDGRFLVLRVPYPLGFYTRGLDGRIDDPRAGWKGRGVYANYGPNAIWHAEGGKGTRSAIVKFQMRPDPLAK
ncbi:MAG: carboxypeptidase regulatory-like domain-containing protein [Acidobacteria bacterium]|nr:carboxypeptidase regulatory-like domain-containing protein [Acidobacteriota bacterium]